jgi:ribosomal protein L7/L12
MAEFAVVTSVLTFFFVLAALMRLKSIEQRLGTISRLEAKLDAMMEHGGVAYDPNKDIPAAVLDALQRGNKIEAIKIYRESTGVGLKEAKDAVEEMQRRAGLGV